jgi:hypothetical protein
MNPSTQLVIGLAGAAMTALAAFAVDRWQQRACLRRVEAWVGGYLTDRYGTPLGDLTVNCSDDRLWPVLAAFADPRTGVRHRLQFACAGRPSTFALQSETEDGR